MIIGTDFLPGKSKHMNVTELRVHPDWEARLDSDLAILILDGSVTLTNDIQIVCLPSDDDVIGNVKGFVVDRDSPKHFVITTLNNSYCYTVNLFQRFFLSPRTFCGTVGNISPIKSVSGDGLFIHSGFAWVQHGVAVSVTNATGDLTGQTLVFFINVKSFKNWIVDTVRLTGDVVGEAIKAKINLECNFVYLYYS